jgi:hypothetical protein
VKLCEHTRVDFKEDRIEIFVIEGLEGRVDVKTGPAVIFHDRREIRVSDYDPSKRNEGSSSTRSFKSQSRGERNMKMPYLIKKVSIWQE